MQLASCYHLQKSAGKKPRRRMARRTLVRSRQLSKFRLGKFLWGSLSLLARCLALPAFHWGKGSIRSWILRGQHIKLNRTVSMFMLGPYLFQNQSQNDLTDFSCRKFTVKRESEKKFKKGSSTTEHETLKIWLRLPWWPLKVSSQYSSQKSSLGDPSEVCCITTLRQNHFIIRAVARSENPWGS